MAQANFSATDRDGPPRTMRDCGVSIGCAHVSSHRQYAHDEDMCTVQITGSGSGSGSLTLNTIDAVRDLHAALGAWLERAKP